MPSGLSTTRLSIVVSAILRKRLLGKPSSIPPDFQISQSQRTPLSVQVALKANNLNDPSLQPPWAQRTFELIHMDIKSFPTNLYHKYKYLIIFLDDFISMALTIPLCTKSAALTATHQFLQIIKMLFQASVQSWILDFSGEYKSAAYNDLLKGKGIRIYNSAPHVAQQNGCTERFMRTLMDKAEAMHHLACLPDSWWEFATTHATHIYNRTPLSRLKWHTPYEVLHSKQPQIDHLHVFGCTAYVFLPTDIWANKLAPKSELMVYLGVAPGNDANFLFVCSPHNVLFTAAVVFLS